MPEGLGRTNASYGTSGRPSWIEPEGADRDQAARALGGEQIFRPDRARRVIEYIQKLTVPSGVGAGQPFKLRPWQVKFIEAIYEPHNAETGNRLVRRAILSMARKNGKTALIAALVLVHLHGPESAKNDEIYSAANDREQAGLVFKMARQMVEAEPELRAVLKVIPSTKTITNQNKGSFYRAVSAESGTKHGFNPTLIIFDELAQAKSRVLYDVLDTSFGARAEPLFITISTQSNDPEHILSKLIDDGISGSDPSIVCHLFAADEDCDLNDEQQWLKANPALGDFRDHNDLATAVSKAIRMPSEEPKVRNLLLNQRVAPTASLISRAEWLACAGKVNIPEGSEVYMALDLSSTTDLTALVIGTAADPTHIRPVFWKPKELLKEHSQRDFGSGNRRYEEWNNAGHLVLSPGRSIHPETVALALAEISSQYRVLGMAYDRWRIQDLLRELDRIGLAAYEDKGDKKGSGLRLVPWGQGYRDMAPAIDAMEIAVVERKLVHPSSPLLNWNMANALATMDPAGNRKIDKEASRFRIDGAVALAMMMGLKARDREQPSAGEIFIV